MTAAPFAPFAAPASASPGLRGLEPQLRSARVIRAAHIRDVSAPNAGGVVRSLRDIVRGSEMLRTLNDNLFAPAAYAWRVRGVLAACWLFAALVSAHGAAVTAGAGALDSLRSHEDQWWIGGALTVSLIAPVLIM